MAVFEGSHVLQLPRVVNYLPLRRFLRIGADDAIRRVHVKTATSVARQGAGGTPHAATNGEDTLPEVAPGRTPTSTVAMDKECVLPAREPAPVVCPIARRAPAIDGILGTWTSGRRSKSTRTWRMNGMLGTRQFRVRERSPRRSERTLACVRARTCASCPGRRRGGENLPSPTLTCVFMRPERSFRVPSWSSLRLSVVVPSSIRSKHPNGRLQPPGVSFSSIHSSSAPPRLLISILHRLCDRSTAEPTDDPSVGGNAERLAFG